METTGIFERSAVTQLLVDRLLSVDKGARVTYKELNEAVGRDVQEEARPNLYSAQRILKSEHGYVFGTEPTVGIYRKTDADIVESEGVEGLRRISNEARRRQQSLRCADTTVLDNEQVTGLHAQMAALGAVRHMAKPKAMLALRGHASETAKKISIKDTLRLMAG